MGFEVAAGILLALLVPVALLLAATRHQDRKWRGQDPRYLEVEKRMARQEAERARARVQIDKV